jgi:hypothetical protein
MSRELLVEAHAAVERVRDEVSGTDTRDLLEDLATRLHHQAEREGTPALGTLDRINAKLEDVEGGIADEEAFHAIHQAPEHILSFLATLDDRGMKQHR